MSFISYFTRSLTSCGLRPSMPLRFLSTSLTYSSTRALMRSLVSCFGKGLLRPCLTDFCSAYSCWTRACRSFTLAERLSLSFLSFPASFCSRSIACLLLASRSPNSFWLLAVWSWFLLLSPSFSDLRVLVLTLSSRSSASVYFSRALA